MAYRYNEKTGEFEDLGNSLKINQGRPNPTHEEPIRERKKESNGWVWVVVAIFAINFLAQLLTALQQG